MLKEPVPTLGSNFAAHHIPPLSQGCSKSGNGNGVGGEPVLGIIWGNLILTINSKNNLYFKNQKVKQNIIPNPIRH